MFIHLIDDFRNCMCFSSKSSRKTRPDTKVLENATWKTRPENTNWTTRPDNWAHSSTPTFIFFWRILVLQHCLHFSKFNSRVRNGRKESPAVAETTQRFGVFFLIAQVTDNVFNLRLYINFTRRWNNWTFSFSGIFICIIIRNNWTSGIFISIIILLCFQVLQINFLKQNQRKPNLI